MTAGEERSLCTHLATMRPDWPFHQIQYEVHQLVEQGYSAADLTAGCAEVAASKQYAPSILGIVVPETIAARYEQRKTQPKTRRRHTADDARICDICTKPQIVCQSSAANHGTLRDHDFVSVKDADLDRSKDPRGAIERAHLFTMPEE